MATGVLNLAPKPSEQVASYDAAHATASKPTTVGYDPSKFSVQSNATVAKQFQDLSRMDSPLLTQARARATRNVGQQMNQRGLINSSMALGAVREAADQAVYDKILPIAQQDATSHFTADTNTTNAINAARYAKMQADNAAFMRGSELETNVSLANADAINKQGAQAAEAANRAQLTDMETARAYGLSDKETARAYGLSDKETSRAYGLSDKETARAYGLSDMETARALQLADKEYERAMGTAQLDADTRLKLAQMDHDTRMDLANVDRNTRVELATIENNYRQLLQTNQDLATMYNQTSTNIANIASSDLSPEAKERATQTQLNILREAIRAKEAVAGTPAHTGSTPSGGAAPEVESLNLGSYFDQGDVNPGADQAGYDKAVSAWNEQQRLHQQKYGKPIPPSAYKPGYEPPRRSDYGL